MLAASHALRRCGTDSDSEVRDLPGLATVFFAFLPVTAIFLDAKIFIGQHAVRVTLIFFVMAFSFLMIPPVRYPKLTTFWGLSPAVLVLLMLMPFFWTRPLSAAMLFFGFLYLGTAPLWIRRRNASRLSDRH